MTNPVFHLPSLDGDTLVLDGAEGRHAATVRRVRVGELLDVVDGHGTRVTGRVTATTRDTVTLEAVRRTTEPAPAPRLTVVQALAKGDRGELAVELLTEVGVDVIVPWAAARCVVRWNDERGDKALARWRVTAREAAKQSRRAWFPEVTEPLTTAAVAELPGRVLVLHESATSPLSAVGCTGAPVDSATPVVIVVGPEGGITEDEIAVLTAAGATAVRLGPSVLRTSTAGAVAAGVVSSQVGRW